MKYLGFLAAVAVMTMSALAEIKLVSIEGEIFIRRGTEEKWIRATAGDVLKPEDSMRSGDNSVATILIDGERKVHLPAGVIVDAADLRMITQEDLLLNLAMEDVRSAPKREVKDRDNAIPKTTTTRGADRDQVAGGKAPASDNLLRLSGAKVLYDNGFFGTCVLRSRELFRIEPRLGSDIDARFRVADALEKMKLPEEAYDAYTGLAKEDLGANDRKKVEERLKALKGAEN